MHPALREVAILTLTVAASCRGAAPVRAAAAEVSRASTQADSARGSVTLTGSCNGGFTLLSLGDDKAVILEGSEYHFGS